MNLVIGATGFLGGAICRRLLELRRPVRALVRSTSADERVAELRAKGAEVILGDLKTPASIQAGLAGVRTVITTATSTVSRQEGDSIEAVDLRGHLHLIEAAKRAGVQHVIYVSFYRHEDEYPLQTAKRAVETELAGSGLPYTIFQPVHFMEVWLSPMVGFDPRGGKVRILGDGLAKMPWISVFDIASFVAGAVDNPKVKNRTFPLGGPDALSALEVVEIFRSQGAIDIALEKVPVSVLRGEYTNAADPMARSIAGLMLGAARGLPASSAAALEAVPVQLTSVRDYAATVLKK